MTPLDADVERELKRVDRRLLAIEPMPMQMAAWQVEMTGLKEDVTDIKRQLEERAKERKLEARDRSQQRTTGRRWMFGTVLAACTFVIGALALLLPLLIGG